jgi:uncharacterized protein (TIGR03067 family)
MEGIVLFIFIAADANEEAAKEFARLKGTWDIVSIEENGEKAKSNSASSVIKGHAFTDNKPKDAESRCSMYTIVIDPTSSPKRLTATITGGGLKGEKVLGIYKLSGDSLTVVWKAGGKDYSTTFESAKDDYWPVFHFERRKSP